MNVDEMNVDELVAVDVHVHAEVSADGHPALPEPLMSGSGRYFKLAGDRMPPVPAIADYYRQRRMAAVVFTVDAQSATGHPPVPSEEVARACAEHADVLIPFASVDPWQGAAAVRRARALVERHGVRGFKFHPSLQAFHPNDRMLLVRYANTLLRDKMLFGSDFPLLTPDRWLADFDTLDIKPEVKPLILKGNAVRLLGLGDSGDA